MRDEKPFVGGWSPIRAGFLNRKHKEQRRQSNISLDPSLQGFDTSEGRNFRSTPTQPESVNFINTGTVDIPAYGAVQLLVWHDQDQYWEACVPVTPCLIKFGICSQDGAIQGSPGIAQIGGFGLAMVPAQTYTGQWLVAAPNATVPGQFIPVSMPMILKVWDFPYPEPTQPYISGFINNYPGGEVSLINDGLAIVRFMPGF